jgi:hypothetical protein
MVIICTTSFNNKKVSYKGGCLNTLRLMSHLNRLVFEKACQCFFCVVGSATVNHVCRNFTF